MSEMSNLNLLDTRLTLGQLREVLKRVYAGVKKDAPMLRAVLQDMTGGDLAAACMLEDVIHWEAHMHTKRDGWWYKSATSWEKSSRIKESRLRRAEMVLARTGLMMELRPNPDVETHRLEWHYKLNWRCWWGRFAQVVGQQIEALAKIVAGVLQPSPRKRRPHVTRRATPSEYKVVRPGDSPGYTHVTQGDTPAARKEATSDSESDSSSGTAFEHTIRAGADAPVVGVVEAADPALLKARDWWDATLNHLEVQLDRASFNTWLRGSRVIRVDDKTTVIGVKNEFARDMLQHRLHVTVQRVFGDMSGEQKAELCFEVKKPDFPVEPPAWRSMVNHELMHQLSAGPQSPADEIRTLYERHIGAPTAAVAEWLDCIADLYDLTTVKAAIANTKLQNSQKRISDPASYMNGVLANMGKSKPVKTLPKLSLVN